MTDLDGAFLLLTKSAESLLKTEEALRDFWYESPEFKEEVFDQLKLKLGIIAKDIAEKGCTLETYTVK